MQQTASAENGWPRDLALALVWPPAVGRAAARAPVSACAIIGSGGVAWMIGMSLSCFATPLGEPFRDLADFFWQAAKGGLVLGSVLAVPIVSPALAIGTRVAQGWKRRGMLPRSARLRAWMLAPVPAILPLLGWCAALLMTCSGDPGDFYGAQPPAWAHSAVFSWLAWVLSPLVLIPAVVCMGVWQAPVAASLAPCTPLCEQCAYDLSGLRGTVCPECGAALQPPPRRKI